MNGSEVNTDSASFHELRPCETNGNFYGHPCGESTASSIELNGKDVGTLRDLERVKTQLAIFFYLRV